MLDMYMRPRFFSRKEVKAEASNAQDCRTHMNRIPETPRRVPQFRPALGRALNPRRRHTCENERSLTDSELSGGTRSEAEWPVRCSELLAGTAHDRRGDTFDLPRLASPPKAVDEGLA
jgi:hypothetical protein